MSDSKREQHPLLGDDLSEDEYLPDSPRYQEHSYKSRTKYCVRGAASIFKQWPDHVSSLLAYWWMGLAMIGFTALIIYNSVLAIAVIPSPKLNKIPSNINTNDVIEYEDYKRLNMHVIVDDLSFDLSNYIPYIEIIIKEHPTFKYNVIVLLNDTEYINNTIKVLEHETSNPTQTHFSILPLPKLINVERKRLSVFLNESPLRKYWRHLPYKFMGFLIRCISIWNKGGMSMNPQLFTPESPHPHYMEKIQDIFRWFEESNIKKQSKKNKTKTKKVNNIRDIIDALENDSVESNGQLKDLNVAENKEFIVLDRNSTDWMQKNSSLNENGYTSNKTSQKRISHMMDAKPVNTNSTKDKLILDTNADGKKLFPMFLKFLFSPTPNTLRKRDDLNNLRDSYEKKSQKNFLKHKKHYYKENTPYEVKTMKSRSLDIDYDLNIDLKGNIVATKTSCHAFLGTIFNTVIHHIKDETVTDLIISELSIFCKGNWMHCKGVDVILL